LLIAAAFYRNAGRSEILQLDLITKSKIELTFGSGSTLCSLRRQSASVPLNILLQRGKRGRETFGFGANPHRLPHSLHTIF
jgi:hypothetical protein